MASKLESKEPPTMKERNILMGLIIALIATLIGDVYLSNKLETAEENYEILTREVRRIEAEDLALLEQTRDVLRECDAIYKANP